MQLEYDLNVGALYIRLSGEPVAQTDEVEGSAAVDVDAAGRVVGIEILTEPARRALATILESYQVDPVAAVQLRAYFSLDDGAPAAEPRLLIPVAESEPTAPLAVGDLAGV